ncbi:MAG: hypothetical protein DMG58_31320 [Acidobacteria bacterium]|nr:MAG: hypothetical protein DMG58_31320 [Acidobacteriota bacterium]
MAADHLVVLHFEFRREIVDLGIGVDIARQVRLIWQREVPHAKAQRQFHAIAGIRRHRDRRFIGSRRSLLAIPRNVDIHPNCLVPLIRPDVVQQIGYSEWEDVGFREQLACPVRAGDQRVGIPAGAERIILRGPSGDIHVPLFEKFNALFRQARRARQIADLDIYARHRRIRRAFDDHLE